MLEDKLISANKLLEDAFDVFDDYNTLLLLVSKQPAVDAKPIIHGQWIGSGYLHLENDRYAYNAINCSECNEDNNKKTNFCPNCGAQMDSNNNLNIYEELKFTREFIHRHGLEFELANEWRNRNK